jgi:hypothetical protein
MDVKDETDRQHRLCGAARSQSFRDRHGSDLRKKNTEAKRLKRLSPSNLQKEAWLKYESKVQKEKRQKTRQESIPKVEADYRRSVRRLVNDNPAKHVFTVSISPPRNRANLTAPFQVWEYISPWIAGNYEEWRVRRGRKK